MKWLFLGVLAALALAGCATDKQSIAAQGNYSCKAYLARAGAPTVYDGQVTADGNQGQVTVRSTGETWATRPGPESTGPFVRPPHSLEPPRASSTVTLMPEGYGGAEMPETVVRERPYVPDICR